MIAARNAGDARNPEPNPNPTEGEKVAENHPDTPAIGAPAQTVAVDRPRNVVECARCDKWWAGTGPHHCGKCHRTFTSLSAFDKHRDGNHANGTRHCVEPQKVGLELTARAYPCWGWPGGEVDWVSGWQQIGDGAA